MKRLAFSFLSTENLRNNFEIIKSFSKSSIIGMVKANAYGHGIRMIAKRLESFGVDGLGVARIDEGIILRESGIKTRIILMEGIFSKEELILASIHDFEIVFHSKHQIDLIYEVFSLPKKIHAWFKIDSGMSRLGFLISDEEQFNFAFSELKRLCFHKKIHEKITLISHLASSGERDNVFNFKQFNLFKKFFDFTEKSQIFHSNFFEKSICNSGGVFNFPEFHLDIIRPGIALYGYSSISSKKTIEIGLKPVMSLFGEIISIKTIGKGNYVGYSQTYEIKEKTKIAIVSIGYGDGYSLFFSNSSFVLGPKMQKLPVVGRVSMDMLAIDIGQYEGENELKIGDFINLWGENLSVEEICEMNHADGCKKSLNVYSVLTSLQNRVKSYWFD
jgi:alanine racemase